MYLNVLNRFSNSSRSMILAARVASFGGVIDQKLARHDDGHLSCGQMLQLRHVLGGAERWSVNDDFPAVEIFME